MPTFEETIAGLAAIVVRRFAVRRAETAAAIGG